MFLEYWTVWWLELLLKCATLDQKTGKITALQQNTDESGCKLLQMYSADCNCTCNNWLQNQKYSIGQMYLILVGDTNTYFLGIYIRVH